MIYKENVCCAVKCFQILICSSVTQFLVSLSSYVVVDSLGAEEMKSELCSLQKLAGLLTGIANVLEVMVSSIKETFTGPLHDLHFLLESTLKSKQV